MVIVVKWLLYIPVCFAQYVYICIHILCRAVDAIDEYMYNDIENNSETNRIDYSSQELTIHLIKRTLWLKILYGLILPILE